MLLRQADALINHFPGLIFIKNNELEYVACSSRFNELSGFINKDEFLGRNDFDLSWSNYADVYRDADRKVLETGNAYSFLEPLRLFNNKDIIVYSRKSPFHDASTNFSGVMCLITLISSPDLVRDIASLSKTDFELVSYNQCQGKQYETDSHFKKFGLTQRETSCLFYIVRGKTAKEISLILNLSKRTIEKHIDRIKSKLSCSSKSEITSKAIEHGFVHFIPSDFIISHFK